MKLVDGLEPLFNYDAGIGHYKISLVGDFDGNGAAVTVPNIPETDDVLEFSSWVMMSNDTQKLSLNQDMRFYNIMDIKVNQIQTGNGYFKLSGKPDLGIPEFGSTNAILTFTKPNADVIAELDPLQNGLVDCGHGVEFTLDQVNEGTQVIEEDSFIAYGDLKVVPSIEEGDPEKDYFLLRGLLTKTNAETKIDVIKVDNQHNPIYSGALPQFFKLGFKKMDVDRGIISVENNKWKTLSFITKPNPEDMPGLDQNNEFKFDVTGNITVGNDDVKVDDFNTGYGKVSMAFNFSDPSFLGSIVFSENFPPISAGYVSIKPKELEMLFDPNGFYLGSKAQINILSVNYLHFNGYVLLAFYGRDLSYLTNETLKDYKIGRPDFSSGLKGMSVLGERNIISKSIGIGKKLDASVDVSIGANLTVNFAGEKQITVGGYGYAFGRGGVDIEICEFYVEEEISVDFISGYQNGGFVFDQCGNMHFKFTIDCPSPFDFSTDKYYHLQLGTSGYSWGSGMCP